MINFLVNTTKNAIKFSLIAGAILIILVLTGFAHADDFEKYCPTIQAIYGVCSPELVQNWLAHTGHATTVKTPPVKEIEAKLPGTEQKENIGETQDQFSPSPPTSVIIPSETPGAPNKTACWCSISGSYRCLEGERFYEKIAYSERCYRLFHDFLNPTPEPWYKNRIWMVS